MMSGQGVTNHPHNNQRGVRPKARPLPPPPGAHPVSAQKAAGLGIAALGLVELRQVIEVRGHLGRSGPRAFTAITSTRLRSRLFDRFSAGYGNRLLSVQSEPAAERARLQAASARGNPHGRPQARHSKREQAHINFAITSAGRSPARRKSLGLPPSYDRR